MRAFLVALLTFTFVCSGVAQQPIPVFRSKADSIRVELLRQQMLETAANPKLRLKSDSLRTLMLELIQTAVLRYRINYQPDPTFVQYRQLSKQGDLGAVRHLSISRFSGDKLPDSLFLCTNLEELELVNTRIRKLPRRLGSLKGLKSITVLNNQPEKRLILRTNSHVEELVFRGDETDKVPRTYHRFRKLKLLDLSRNGLASFPDIRKSKSIRSLNLSQNRLTLSDLAGKGNKHLITLNLSNNLIQAVPAEISGFPGLAKLDFNNNQISTVSPGILKLTRLDDMSFYHNKLTQIPEPIYNMTNLKVIDLYYNEIEKVDPKISHMENLRILYLSNNKVYSLPDDLGKLTNLRELYLHHNRLSNLPETIGELRLLTVLRVNQNGLLELPASITRLTALENFDFSHNQIQNFPLQQFQFSSLRILALVGNPWDDSIRKLLPEWANKLRKEKTIVHLNTYEDEVENK